MAPERNQPLREYTSDIEKNTNADVHVFKENPSLIEGSPSISNLAQNQPEPRGESVSHSTPPLRLPPYI